MCVYIYIYIYVCACEWYNLYVIIITKCAQKDAITLKWLQVESNFVTLLLVVMTRPNIIFSIQYCTTSLHLIHSIHLYKSNRKRKRELGTSYIYICLNLHQTKAKLNNNNNGNNNNNSGICAFSFTKPLDCHIT